MAIAVLEDVFFQHADTVRQTQHCHEDRLCIGGKTGVGHGTEKRHRPQPPRCQQVQPIRLRKYPTAGLFQHREHILHGLGADTTQAQRPAGNCRRPQIGHAGNAVGHDRVTAAPQLPDTGDHNGAFAVAGDVCPAAPQKCRQIADLRFSCRIVQHRSALCQHRRQHDIFRSSYRGERQVYACSVQSLRCGAVQLSPMYRKMCTHLPQGI